MIWDVGISDEPEREVERVREFLVDDEALHNVALGILDVVAKQGDYFGVDPFVAWVEREGSIGGVALRTPPHPGLISRTADAEAATRLADVLADEFPELPSLNILRETAGPVRDRLQERDFGWSVEMRQRIYRATQIEPPEGVPGGARQVPMKEVRQVIDWMFAFVDEAEPESEQSTTEQVEKRARTLVEHGNVFSWRVDGRAVSMAAHVGRTPNGVRIGYVYTPPDERANGYGSAVTAAASRAALEAGNDHLFLFTDLENDTTNSIYPRIGYEPVGDLDHVVLDS